MAWTRCFDCHWLQGVFKCCCGNEINVNHMDNKVFCPNCNKIHRIGSNDFAEHKKFIAKSRTWS